LALLACSLCFHGACFPGFKSSNLLCLQIRMLGEEGGKDASGVHEHGDDVFLKKIESHLLTQVPVLVYFELQ